MKKKKEAPLAGDQFEPSDLLASPKVVPLEVILDDKVLCEKSTAPSPTHSLGSSASFSWIRERELENTNENLQEMLKDTEERYHSLKMQYESLSQVHRVLRESHVHLQEETEKMKIDFQIVKDCTNVLRCELNSAKQDHESAKKISQILQQELEENRVDGKKFQEIADRDSKTILDLQRQCREMERILVRKHPDSVSALIVASKNSNNCPPDTSASTRKLLEERIAQLESDAKEQDKNAQMILSNVQSRFKTVQAKYETHIQDLETQVLSLQQINMEVNKELYAKSVSMITSSSQTIDVPEKDFHESRNVGTQTSALSNPPSRSGSAQSISGTKKLSKLPNSNSDSPTPSKEDAHLLANIRGMRVELAIKEKAVQRLTRDLEESKKTIRKLQKERDNYLSKDKSSAPTTMPSKVYNPAHYQENSDLKSLKCAQEKIKMLESDFKLLYEKRIKDVSFNVSLDFIFLSIRF